jgi:hypothetical protein
MKYKDNELVVAAHGSIYLQEDWFIVPKGITICLYNPPGFFLYCKKKNLNEKIEPFLTYTGGDLMFDIHFYFTINQIAPKDEYNKSCALFGLIRSDVEFPFKFNIDKDELTKLENTFNNKQLVNFELFKKYCINKDLKDIINEENYDNFYLKDIINASYYNGKDKKKKIKIYHIFTCLGYEKNDNIKYPYGFNKDPENKYYTRSLEKIKITDNLEIQIFGENVFSISNVTEVPQEVKKFLEKNDIEILYIIIFYIDNKFNKIYYRFIHGFFTDLEYIKIEYEDYEFCEIPFMLKDLRQLNEYNSYEKLIHIFVNKNIFKVLKGNIISNKDWGIIRRPLSTRNPERDLEKEKVLKQIKEDFTPFNVIKEIQKCGNIPLETRGKIIDDYYNKNEFITFGGKHLGMIYDCITNLSRDKLKEEIKNLQNDLKQGTQFGCAKARTIDLVLMKRNLKSKTSFK